MIVYKTTNLINGKIYVGKDAKNDPNCLGSGTYLRNAIKKYGRENFKKEILENCKNDDRLSEREIFWIAELKSTDPSIGYNITSGGDGWNSKSASESANKRWNSYTEDEKNCLSVAYDKG